VRCLSRITCGTSSETHRQDRLWDGPHAGGSPVAAGRQRGRQATQRASMVSQASAGQARLLVQRGEVLLVGGVVQAVVERAVQRGGKLALAEHGGQLGDRPGLEVHLLGRRVACSARARRQGRRAAGRGTGARAGRPVAAPCANYGQDRHPHSRLAAERSAAAATRLAPHAQRCDTIIASCCGVRGGRAGSIAAALRLGDGLGREVDAGGLHALAAEEDGVCAVPAAHVEHLRPVQRSDSARLCQVLQQHSTPAFAQPVLYSVPAKTRSTG